MSDKDLGMQRPIARRDFLQGAAIGVGACLLGGLAPNKALYESLGLHHGVFFDRETFGVDRLVVRKGDSREATQAYLAQTPLSESVRRDILRIEHGDEDYLPRLTSDIEGIAVNRWPHGYAPEYNSLVDGDTPAARMPNIIGRARFGRIAIANSDAGMGAYTDVAIEQAHRAVQELLNA